MSCKRIALLSPLIVWMATGLVGCGRKEAPKPPIQIIPARTVDLLVQQRGSDLVLAFSYPQTTVAGTALGGIRAVELWAWDRRVPVATFVAPPEEETGASTETEPAAMEGNASAGAEGAETSGEPASPALPDEAPSEEASPDSGVDEAQSEAASPDNSMDEAPRVVTLERIVDAAIELPEDMTRLEELVPPDPAEFTASAVRHLILEGAELDSAISGDRIRTRITLPELDQRSELDVRAYAVKTISNTGRGSAYSNVAWIVRRDPPASPTEFEVRPASDGVELRWSYAGRGPAEDPGIQGAEAAEPPSAAPEGIEVEEIVDDGGIEAFHVYRRSARSPHYEAALARVDKELRTYVDRGAAFGESYIYAITAILRTGPLVESSLSTEREVDYEDRFPPTPPRNLVTFSDSRSVRLLWDASGSSDVAGYFVERRQGSEAEWVALHTDPITVLEYTDQRVRSGQTYEYRVLAADQNGLKGDPSSSVEVRIP